MIVARHLEDARLDQWMGDQELVMAELEVLTSKWLRSHVSFRVVACEDAALRRRWSQGLLASGLCPRDELPPRWLGLKANDPRVAATGIWVPPAENQPALDQAELAALTLAVEHSLGLNA